MPDQTNYLGSGFRGISTFYCVHYWQSVSPFYLVHFSTPWSTSVPQALPLRLLLLDHSEYSLSTFFAIGSTSLVKLVCYSMYCNRRRFPRLSTPAREFLLLWAWRSAAGGVPAIPCGVRVYCTTVWSGRVEEGDPRLEGGGDRGFLWFFWILCIDGLISFGLSVGCGVRGKRCKKGIVNRSPESTRLASSKYMYSR